MSAFSISALCNCFDSHSISTPSGTPQKANVRYVEIFASPPASGKIVRKPSNAAFPGLSVTPGLKPTDTTISGFEENNSELFN